MHDDLPTDDRLAVGLKHYASRVLVGRNVAAVIADVTRSSSAPRFRFRPFGLLATAAAMIVLVGAGVLFATQAPAMGPATAEVDGLTYTVAVARSLVVTDADLSAYGELSRIDGGLPLEGQTVYAIVGVDPTRALVVRLASGARDEAGLYGKYALLVRGPFAGLCQLFDPASEATPTDCR